MTMNKKQHIPIDFIAIPDSKNRKRLGNVDIHKYQYKSIGV